MMNNIRSMKDAVERIWNSQNEETFQSNIALLHDYLKRIGMGKEEQLALEKNAYYIHNEYSDKNTKENMQDAKKRVVMYIESLMNDTVEDEQLLKILNNFYLFLECLTERIPDKRGGIQKDQLSILKIKNEYDVQYLLYACIKPVFPMARTEVNEDTGYSTVRPDIYVDGMNVIEVKCTREGMKLKKLIEEIEADMVHYSAENIYFFLYDKAKIIENPEVFKETYERKVKGKKIHIIIHQPKIL